MTSGPLEVIRPLLGDWPMGVARDMRALFEDEDYVAAIAAFIADDAEILFEGPVGELVGDMAGPWRGPGGLRDGWREWTSIWASWTFAPTELIDAGDGKVLLLGISHGRLPDSDTEIETPGAALYTVAAERIVRIAHFLDQDQARRAAGLEA